MRPLHIERDLGRPAGVVRRRGSSHAASGGVVDHRELAGSFGCRRQRQAGRDRNDPGRTGGQAEFRVERRQFGNDVGIVESRDDIDGLPGTQFGSLGRAQRSTRRRQQGQAIGSTDLRRRVGGNHARTRHRLELSSHGLRGQLADLVGVLQVLDRQARGRRGGHVGSQSILRRCAQPGGAAVGRIGIVRLLQQARCAVKKRLGNLRLNRFGQVGGLDVQRRGRGRNNRSGRGW